MPLNFPGADEINGNDNPKLLIYFSHFVLTNGTFLLQQWK
jgi:hypothetical protein